MLAKVTALPWKRSLPKGLKVGLEGHCIPHICFWGALPVVLMKSQGPLLVILSQPGSSMPGPGHVGLPDPYGAGYHKGHPSGVLDVPQSSGSGEGTFSAIDLMALSWESKKHVP